MTDDEPNIAPESGAAMLPLSLTGVLKSAPIERPRRFAGVRFKVFGGAVRSSPYCRADLSNVEYRLRLADPLIGI